MKYDPKSANGSLIPDSECDIEIADAEETTSKTGKEMIKLTVRVWAGGGGPRVIFDYIVNPDSLWRLKQIAGAMSKQDLFDSGEMGAAEIKGASLRATIKTQRDKTGKFEDKNVIARYLPASAGVTRDDKHGPAAGDEEIPF